MQQEVFFTDILARKIRKSQNLDKKREWVAKPRCTQNQQTQAERSQGRFNGVAVSVSHLSYSEKKRESGREWFVTTSWFAQTRNVRSGNTPNIWGFVGGRSVVRDE